MTKILSYKLLQHLNKRKLQDQSAFTLVELIVVVVIIGILSAIAVPSFNNASDKAKQKEASVLIASYVKAAQAFYTENSTLPEHSGHLGQYISITGCSQPDPQACKSNPPNNLSASDSRSWISPSGLYSVGISQGNTQVQFTANPAGDFQGYGVGGCFSSLNGVTRVVEATQKGDQAPPTCD